MAEKIEHKMAERDILSEILDLINERRDIKSLLEDTAVLLRDYLGCEAIGIRVMDELGNIPYETHLGFSDAFVAKEGHLCIRHDRCACIEISMGEYDPGIPLYTPHGSFYTGQLQDLEPVKEGMKTGRFRGNCVLSGWQSLALVPIRYAHKYLGLIHVVDAERNKFPAGRVKFVENIAGLLGLYMNGLDAGEEKEKEFSSLVNRIMHDLRNPLSAIMTFTELTSMRHAKELSPEVSDFLSRISRNAEHMEELITGLNMFAHACVPEREKQGLDLGVFVRTLIEDMGLREDKRIDIRVADNMPTVNYPQLCLRRVLENLISNAVKYSSSPVEVSYQEKDMFYQISVSDDGMGIDASEVEKIFYPFYRSKDARKVKGTGLGLTICRKIVEKNGGKIWAYSDKGKGSTFYFTVPK